MIVEVKQIKLISKFSVDFMIQQYTSIDMCHYYKEAASPVYRLLVCFVWNNAFNVVQEVQQCHWESFPGNLVFYVFIA